MKILLHICCGPCAIYPVNVLQEEDIEFQGFFYNPNIHPFLEYERRILALEEVASKKGFKVLWAEDGYGLTHWLGKIGENLDFDSRCPICYEIRLERTAREAKLRGFSHFSTTLLYSRYQRHHLIKEIAEKKALKHGVKFYYQDFRQGWQQGIIESKEMGIYRQPYCGCVLSEAERYGKRMKRLQSRLKEGLKDESNA